jgi:hypothetical protein
MPVEMMLMIDRKGNAALLHIIAIPQLLRRVSRIVMPTLCVELILSMANRNVLWDFAVHIWGTAE